MTTGQPQVGRTRDVGWEIGVSRTVRCSLERAWEVLTGDGVAVWLGQLDGALPQQPGDTGRTLAGDEVEIRSFRRSDRVRLVVRTAGSANDSTVQFTVRATGPGRTAIRFHQERLASAAERAARRHHWLAVVDALTPLLEA